MFQNRFSLCHFGTKLVMTVIASGVACPKRSKQKTTDERCRLKIGTVLLRMRNSGMVTLLDRFHVHTYPIVNPVFSPLKYPSDANPSRQLKSFQNLCEQLQIFVRCRFVPQKLIPGAHFGLRFLGDKTATDKDLELLAQVLEGLELPRGVCIRRIFQRGKDRVYYRVSVDMESVQESDHTTVSHS